MISFRVNGTPAPQGSKRHVGGGRMIESSARVAPWREAVRGSTAAAISEQGPYAVVRWYAAAVSVTLVFVFARPAGHYRTAKGHTHEPRGSAPRFPAARGRNDIDKLCRATLDGLVDGGLLADDGLVVSLSAAKVYAADGQVPGCLIEVEAMT